MDSFKRYILKHGLPQSVYLDRHTTYKAKRKPTIDEDLADRKPQSQFGRALEELGVHLIHAQSAPAKGRIERLFKTLQDRLIKEMRLRGIGSIAAANEFLSEYLPVFNKRFSVEPQSPYGLHRPLPKGIELNKVFSIRTPKTLFNNFTIAHKGRLYQVEDNVRTREVIAEERLDGSLVITYKARALRYKQIMQRPLKVKPPHKPHVYKPAAMDNPWRKFHYGRALPVHKEEEVFAGAL
jgi:hypothetical protein